MLASTRDEPTYVFRITPELSLRWLGLSIILFFVSLAGVSGFYEAVHGQSWSVSWQATQYPSPWSSILPFLAFLAILIGTFVVHELLHGVAFRAFGGSPRYGVEAKYFLPYAYATSPGDRFSRNAFVVIGLAPLVIIDLVSVLLLAIFPQASWLGLVIAINTSGASGDIWMATLLLRSPKSIQVEDRRAGMAIYTPSHVDPRSLPFKTYRARANSGLWVWVNTMMIVLVVLFLASFLLPPIFAILQVPSFGLGTDGFWIIRWQNDEQGTSIAFNLVSLLIMATAIGLLGVLVKAVQKRR